MGQDGLLQCWCIFETVCNDVLAVMQHAQLNACDARPVGLTGFSAPDTPFKIVILVFLAPLQPTSLPSRCENKTVSAYTASHTEAKAVYSVFSLMERQRTSSRLLKLLVTVGKPESPIKTSACTCRSLNCTSTLDRSTPTLHSQVGTMCNI